MQTTHDSPAPATHTQPAGAMAAEPLPTFDMEDDEVGLDMSGWLALAAGFGLAILTQVVPVLEMLIGYMVVLVHEMGHAIAGWMFGYPSIPAFDFRYGGGVTSHGLDQSFVLVALVGTGLMGLAWVLRRNTASLILIGCIGIAYFVLALTSLHQVAIIALGHGAELIFAFIFLSRAFTGKACSIPAERPLYAWLGFHIVLHGLVFAWGLMTSAQERAQYAGAKGGGHWMDFSRLANEHLGISLESVAGLFFLLCLSIPLLAFAWSWFGPARIRAIDRLREV